MHQLASKDRAFSNHAGCPAETQWRKPHYAAAFFIPHLHNNKKAKPIGNIAPFGFAFFC